MAHRITDFLVDLSNNPKKLEAFAEDPEAVLDGAQLTDEARAALLSRNPAEVRAVVDSESKSLMPIIGLLQGNDIEDEPTPIRDPSNPGSLVVVGTGIKLVAHITIEAVEHIKNGDKVLYLVADSTTEEWVRRLNPTAESLYRWSGQRVCFVLYGHPGVFALTSHEAVRRAREEGFAARMTPGVSAEDCLLADLSPHLGRPGCQSYDATEFLIHNTSFDTSVLLVLFVIGAIGDASFSKRAVNRDGVQILAEYLESHYGSDHEVLVYEASTYPVCEPIIQRTTISRLADTPISPISTLVVPPTAAGPADSDMLQKLRTLEGRRRPTQRGSGR
jgi:precorrin-6B methylase 1